MQKQIIQNIRNRYPGKRIGFTCSCFDILHCGHALMLKDAKDQCDILVVGLQTDPTLDRPEKNKPVQEYEERDIMIRSIRYVDEVIEYSTEADLMDILKTLNPDVRIIGTDWKGKEFTGHELPIKIHWHERNHPWSTSGLRARVYACELAKLK